MSEVGDCSGPPKMERLQILRVQGLYYVYRYLLDLFLVRQIRRCYNIYGRDWFPHLPSLVRILEPGSRETGLAHTRVL